MDTNKAIRDFAELTLAEANKFMQDIKAELQVINKNTFVERLRNYFLDNPSCAFVTINSSSDASNDGMYFSISVYALDDQDNDMPDNFLEGLDTEIFDMYEGMESSSMSIMYMKDFSGFDDYTTKDDDQEDEDEG